MMQQIFEVLLCNRQIAAYVILLPQVSRADMPLYHYLTAARAKGFGDVFTDLITRHKDIEKVDVVLKSSVDRFLYLLKGLAVEMLAAQADNAAPFSSFSNISVIQR